MTYTRYVYQEVGVCKKEFRELPPSTPGHTFVQANVCVNIRKDGFVTNESCRYIHEEGLIDRDGWVEEGNVYPVVLIFPEAIGNAQAPNEEETLVLKSRNSYPTVDFVGGRGLLIGNQAAHMT